MSEQKDQVPALMSAIIQTPDGVDMPPVGEKRFTALLGTYVIERTMDDKDAIYPVPEMVLVSSDGLDDLEEQVLQLVRESFDVAREGLAALQEQE